MSLEQLEQTPDDLDLSEILWMARALKITVHVRGTDSAPVVEFRDKYTRRVVGGSEFKRRVRESGI